ncbi:hypothetical protein N7468_007299 [Penicillium chermesinum]|uniref:Uncharacterized protein n=1 Tax=Penicillium chermesinum TaxID=63820 RepID=A0A9W9NWS1_9EURO|nr:uncharacterized protein N7468_007299 [Penicillium chermesinum]KAJ5226074.1 hypothetical protein N7468_007299 [Penicillium chermesinum]
MVICQASRVEMEKDELLNLHRSIVDSNFKLNEGLRMALRNAAMESQQNEAFLKAVHQLQQQLTASIEKSQSTFQDTFSKILHDVQVGVRSAFSGITSSLSVMGKDMAALEKNVHNITSQVHSLKSSLGEIHKDAIGLSKELFQVQQENSLAHQDLTLGLRRSLESLLSRDLVMIFQAMHEFNNSLEWLGSRLNEVSEREAKVAERLKAVNQDMKKSEEKAQDLHKAQKLQADALIAHAKTQGELQATAKISQELVEQTSMAAAHLHSILEDAALKAQRLPDFRIGGFNTWTLCFIIVITITASRSPIVATGILFTFVGHWIARAILPYLGAIIPHH